MHSIKSISIFARYLVLVLLFSRVRIHLTQSAVSSLQCNRLLNQIDECPTDSSIARTEQQCNGDGCYYCSGANPSCIQGVGCSWKNMSDPANECRNARGRRIFRKRKCYNAGCSWCQRQTGVKCFKNPTSRDDLITPPDPSADNCPVDNVTLRMECEYLVKERGDEQVHCAASGCHWCPLTGHPSCIQGQVCLTQKVNGEYDCRKSPTEVLTEYECLQRSCSWCPDNAAFKCVRDQPVGVSDLSCSREIKDISECPVSGVTNEQECKDNGCFYCDSLATPCVQGVGCSWVDTSLSTECNTKSGGSITDKKICREAGCSWCEHYSGYKCFRNPYSEDDIVTAPMSYDGNCAASRTECPYADPTKKGTQVQCWLSGCHWCATGSPSCVQGTVCDSQRTGPEYDCRSSPTETLTPYECLHRGCSWCASNADFKCVRDLPDTPQTCLGNETLNCFPFPTIDGVSEQQCNDQYRCSYCNDSTAENQCMRQECPPDWELRYDGQSCCQSPDDAVSTSDSARSMAARIIGGTDAAVGQWPWQVLYLYYNSAGQAATCGGAIIAPKIVMTAAHCKLTLTNAAFSGLEAGYIYAGSTVFLSGAQIKVAEAIPFPYYSNTLHDIMVLKLFSEVPSHATPLSLPMGEEPVPGMNCFLAGWGDTDPTTGFAIPLLLQEAQLYIPTAAECTSGFQTYDPAFQICANASLTPQSACFGDSGGPLVCQRCSSCEWYAAGITSFVLGNVSAACFTNAPSYYSRVEPYMDFLLENGAPAGDQAYSCDSF